MKQWLKRNVLDIIYLWTGLLASLVYVVTGDAAYLIAALVAPITQNYYSRGNK